MEGEGSKQCVSCFDVCLVLVNLILINSSSQNSVILVQADIPNLRTKTLQASINSDISVRLIGSIELGGFSLVCSIVDFNDNKVG